MTVFGALGCGRVREIKGCRALAGLVNPTLDDIAEHLEKDRGAAPYRHAAASYQKLATDLKRFDLGIPRTQKSVEELGTVMKDASGQAKRLADAIDQRDVGVAAQARRDLSHLSRVQKSIVSRIDNDCDG
jgi:hypothetical protein